ncbi:MAG: XTP/dITP diphosphatase [Candidatus Odinarchaeia archaeon]
MREIYFATGNYMKVKEATAILSKYNIKVLHLPVERIEIQSSDLCEIAAYSARKIVEEEKKTVFVEDTGIFIECLNGFPGPYSSYVFKTIGNEGILKLMRNVKNRKAVFRSVIALCEPGSEPKCVKAEVKGKISQEQRGDGWGYDPIFIPEDGDERTYAEMTLEEKNKISHRYRVLKRFAEELASKKI